MIVNGCSFSDDKQRPTWATYVKDRFEFEIYENLARGAAGNFYICDSTINFLESAGLDPQETCVIVMWSGTGRKDLRISGDWYYHLKKNYRYLTQADSKNDSFYLFSGGLTNSWFENSDTKQIFNWLYKLSDPQSLCMDSFTHMIKLENYLQNHNYHYAMTSYVNYWQGESCHGSGDYSIPWFLKDHNIIKNYTFDQWFFVNQQKDTLFEFANNLAQLDNTQHPTALAHQQFADEIVVHQVLSKFMCNATKAA